MIKTTADSTTAREMLKVIAALIPGYIALSLIFGPGALIHAAIMVPVAMLAEATIIWMRSRSAVPAIKDLSAPLTALLLAAALPPLLPWWMAIVGILFAIIIAKQLYGGLGQNPFNPAMVGYVILLVSFPLEMTSWLTPAGAIVGGDTIGFIQSAEIIFGTIENPSITIDGVTGATPLDAMKTALYQGLTISEGIKEISNGVLAGSGWEIINLTFLIGGIYLIASRTISWHIPVSMLVALLIISALFNTVDPDRYSTPLYHLLSGGTMLGAFFIATDPVTASTTPRGRIWFGACIGILIYTIRSWGGYPDAVAFSVLLLNMFTPLIDHFTQPKIYGERDNG